MLAPSRPSDKRAVFLITALISFISILVSITQIVTTSINKSKELELARINQSETLRLQGQRDQRQWNLEVAKFMAEHRKALFAVDEDALNLQKIMLATFPSSITSQPFGDLSRLGTNDASFWADAERQALLQFYPRVKIFYEASFPHRLIDLIGDTLDEGYIAYDYLDQAIPEHLTQGDVRFFHPEDEALALRVKADFENLACYNGYKLTLNLTPLLDSPLRAPANTLEVWLSGKAITFGDDLRQCDMNAGLRDHPNAQIVLPRINPN